MDADHDNELADVIAGLVTQLMHAEQLLRAGRCGFERRRQVRDLLRGVADAVHASMPEQHPKEHGFSASGPPPELSGGR